jgi:flagellum-specific ATP synthase
VRSLLAVQADMADMVHLGAYRPGTDATVDEALRLAPRIEAFLRQAKGERTGFEEAFANLEQVLGGSDAG